MLNNCSTSFKLFLILSICTLHIDLTLSTNSVILDKASDLWRVWKLRGDYMYFPNGSQLKEVYDKFPKDFDFKSFQTTKGIWAIFPQITFSSPGMRLVPEYFSNNTAFKTASWATISYTGFAQLIDSVTIRYSLNHGSNITVSKSSSDFPFYTIEPSGTTSYKWITTIIPLQRGSAQFVIQANTNSSDDFVLIDRIEATYVEVTTKRTTTTTRPTSAPPTSIGNTMNYICYLNFTLICLILHTCLMLKF